MPALPEAATKAELLEEIERLRDCLDALCTTSLQVTLRVEVRYSKRKHVLIVTGPRSLTDTQFAKIVASHLKDSGASELKVESAMEVP